MEKPIEQVVVNTTPEDTQRRVSEKVKKKGKRTVDKKNKSLETLNVEYVNVNDIHPNEWNPNRQSDHDFELLLKSMSEVERLEKLLCTLLAGLMKQRVNSAQSTEKLFNSDNVYRNYLVFRMLLKSGADANLAMADGRTPIHIAAESGNIGVIKLLLENDADILATDEVSSMKIKFVVFILCFRMEKLPYTRPVKCATMMYSSV